MDLLAAASLAIGTLTVGLMGAFALALRLDQPFGPILVAVLLGIAAGMPLLKRSLSSATVL